MKSRVCSVFCSIALAFVCLSATPAIAGKTSTSTTIQWASGATRPLVSISCNNTPSNLDYGKVLYNVNLLKINNTSGGFTYSGTLTVMIQAQLIGECDVTLQVSRVLGHQTGWFDTKTRLQGSFSITGTGKPASVTLTNLADIIPDVGGCSVPQSELLTSGSTSFDTTSLTSTYPCSVISGYALQDSFGLKIPAGAGVSTVTINFGKLTDNEIVAQ